jgi:UDP-N-acetylmuramoyl-tripeptide--D-alanyl-D-alanine ligase
MLRRAMLISRATKKLKQFPQIRIIAVTGSYGKTTTKEIIEQIINKKFNTIKTQKHNNTEVGIAKTILNQANKDTRIFVAEMGAYKLGETEACARIAPPDIAIITGIDEQHMSLYGSFKAIIKSTLEIVDELKPNGVVILNGDNDYCLRLAEQINKPKRIYFTNEFYGAKPGNKKTSSPLDENLYISDVSETEKGLMFTVAYKGDREKIKTNIKAKHNVGNVACAIITACELGLELKEIIRIINGTEFTMPYLAIKYGINNARVIDDGYNINPSGYYAGLKYLSEQSVIGKKWVLTQGFIELGDEKESTYKKVAKETIKLSDGVITNDIDLCIALTDAKKDFNVAYTESVFNISLLAKRDVQEGDLILIEGPFPKQVLDKLYSPK